MNRPSNRINYKTAAAVLLVVALLARMPFAHGLLLHDHGDDGVHSHVVTVDEMRQVDFYAEWHRHHDDDHDDRNNDSDAAEYAHSTFVFLNISAIALNVRGSFGTGIVSIRQLSPKVSLPSMLLIAPTGPSVVPSAQPPRPVSALAAILQSSHALLL